MTTYEQIARHCRHARLGYLDGQSGTAEDIAIRLRDLDQSVRWWQAVADRLTRERLDSLGEEDPSAAGG